jgi:hypothetical protein
VVVGEVLHLAVLTAFRASLPKPLKRLHLIRSSFTALKRGVNEMSFHPHWKFRIRTDIPAGLPVAIPPFLDKLAA